MTHEIIALITQHGLLIVFLSVLIAQAGVPLPAAPTLVVAGALAANGQLPIAAILLVALVACLLGDLLWYWAGRRFGGGVLRQLCRISLSPDSCVRHSELYFERWRGQMLLIAKFVPGLSTVAPPLVGAMGLPLPMFVLLDGLGSLLWAGVAVGLGYAFATQIDGVLAALFNAGAIAIGLALGLLTLYVLGKWWRRRRLLLALRMPRITVEELNRSMTDSPPPLVIDVRSQTSRRLDPRIVSGALLADLDRVDQTLHKLPLDRELVIYCDCPNEASSAKAAKALTTRGYLHVRSLEGGLNAWGAAGYPVQRLPLAADVSSAIAALTEP